ncbi:YiiD C-terminal domain-containing protein [Gimesia sp.]|uniref:YiiD C-terminal domain-containing protein n=1 Tax=Gimesia sp. TaxID=2024833 RepID=UPI000C5935B2|nr:YiiD C-terminal domain-containing protein [Gimesia sp.]MAX38172.1 thioesterase [Gimesia sp.]HAH44418.1 thioesterase [Planctomycetaceae bacterium]HBL47909.1 thioesterase [Planctomycetaceae bacterium]|tara:strand:+ start:181 stop:633 length:453 start_codon:yes stop_codon:yes gene_type:complete
MMEFDVEEVTAYLHQHIPVTRAMQFSVLPVSEGALKLSAKLTPNLNHQETAFGGSIASLGILAGWTLIHLRLRADLQKYKIVIQKSEIEFLRPIESDFTAECPVPDDRVWSLFHDSLQRKQRGRIALESTVKVNGQIAAVIKGIFVAKVL